MMLSSEGGEIETAFCDHGPAAEDERHSLLPLQKLAQLTHEDGDGARRFLLEHRIGAQRDRMPAALLSLGSGPIMRPVRG